VVNALSDWLDLTIHREGFEHFVRFVEGGRVEAPLVRRGASPKRENGKPYTGTAVRLFASPSTFTMTDYDRKTLEHRLRELTFLNSGVKIIFRDERGAEPFEITLEYEGGVKAFVQHIDRQKQSLIGEPIYVIGQANDVGKMDARIYIGIYQGLINDYESFDVGFFDLIIADESHRSIYNLYGDLFKYFDAIQVGLTATPVEMVSRSTCRLFGCDYKLPTANYPLEQAIADRNLVPFRVVAHTTKFLREGIKGAHLSDEQIAQLRAFQSALLSLTQASRQIWCWYLMACKSCICRTTISANTFCRSTLR
jgi:hypothetical protein